MNLMECSEMLLPMLRNTELSNAWASLASEFAVTGSYSHKGKTGSSEAGKGRNG